MKRFVSVASALAVGLVFASEAARAAPKAPSHTIQKVAHLSCKGAWQAADKSVDKAFAMIETMTVYLLKQRQLQFPDDAETGQRFGKAIDERCRADPDQLMLSAVDAALREVLSEALGEVSSRP